MLNDDNNTTTSGSLLGKFREKLRKIKLSRAKKKKLQEIETKKFTQEKVKEIKKSLSDPAENLTNKKNKSIKIKVIKKSKYKKITSSPPPKNNKLSLPNSNSQRNQTNDTKTPTITNIAQNKDKGISKSPTSNNPQDPFVDKVITKIKETKKDREYGTNYGPIPKNKNSSLSTPSNIANSTNDTTKQELKQKIISKIKNDFNKKISELEVLESELYNLKEQNNEELELEKIEKLKEEINSIIKKINKIIDEYNIYRTNYSLEDIIDLPDKILVDDIITYKHLVENNSSNKELVNDYKLLKEFQTLYNKLDEIKTTSDNLIAENTEKINNLKERDNKYKDTINSIKAATETVKYCNYEIEKQNKYFTDLLKKVSIINKEEYTKYKFRSLGNMITDTINYLSTIALSRHLNPVSKIFIRTLAANRLLKNISNNMHVEQVKKIEYSAKNYDREIISKISDIDFTYELINDTLYTIKNIKEDFLLMYNSNIPGYQDTLKKLDKIEEKIINNKYKMDTIKNNLNKTRKLNENKIKKLEKLKQTT